MTAHRKRIAALVALVAFAWVGSSAVRAGDIDLAWEAVTDPDVVGYRIFYGAQPGPPYASFRDVGLVTQATLTGVADCTWIYVAVKAREFDGTLSDDYSNVVQGFTHPRIVSVSPTLVDVGGTATLVIQGSSFAPGATPALGGAGLTIDSYSVDGCGQLTLDVTADPQAAPGWRSLEIQNTDGSFGTLAQAVNVQVAPTQCALVGVSPPPGSGDVDGQPTVQASFSCPLDPARVNGKRFQLRRSGPPGRSSGKATATPVLEAGGTTVTFALGKPLDSGQAYAVFVKGGANGARYMTGETLPADYQQAPSFTTEVFLDRVTYGPTEAGATTELLFGAQIPADSVLVVHFTEPLDLVSITGGSLKISRKGGKVALQGGEARLSADRRSAILEPADGELPSGSSLTIEIKGGSRGVRTTRGVVLAQKQNSIPFTTSVGTVPSLGIAE